MKKNIIRTLLLLILIADMVFIFVNSAQDSTESATTSQSVTEMVAPVIVPNYKEMDSETQKQAVSSLDVYLREAAHLLQFVPMGFALYLLLCTFSLPFRIRYIEIPITLCFGILYALSDEIHQIFSPGRAFQLFDIMMDTCGVTIGLIAALILNLIIAKINKRETDTAK